MASPPIRITSRIGSALCPPVRAGEGIAMSGLVAAWAAWLGWASVVRRIRVTGWPRWVPSAPEAMPALRPSLMPSWQRWAPLRSSAVFGRGGIGSVAAGARRGGDGFDIAAGFGVDEALQPRHAIGSAAPGGGRGAGPDQPRRSRRRG